MKKHAKGLLILGFAVVATNAMAEGAGKTLVSCSKRGTSSQTSDSVVVTQRDDGRIEYSISTCYKIRFLDCNENIIYQSSGVVDADKFEGKLTGNFKSGEASLQFICGHEYLARDQKRSFVFAPNECTFNLKGE